MKKALLLSQDKSNADESFWKKGCGEENLFSKALLCKSQGLIPLFLLIFLNFLFPSNKNPVCIVFYAVLFSQFLSAAFRNLNRILLLATEEYFKVFNLAFCCSLQKAVIANCRTGAFYSRAYWATYRKKPNSCYIQQTESDIRTVSTVFHRIS